jgi:antitoxin VapB
LYCYISAGHAVRIPAELAYERSDLEPEIERCGDELRIRPAGRPSTAALQALASFSPSLLAAGREQEAAGSARSQLLTLKDLRI